MEPTNKDDKAATAQAEFDWSGSDLTLPDRKAYETVMLELMLGITKSLWGKEGEIGEISESSDGLTKKVTVLRDTGAA